MRNFDYNPALANLRRLLGLIAFNALILTSLLIALQKYYGLLFNNWFSGFLIAFLSISIGLRLNKKIEKNKQQDKQH